MIKKLFSFTKKILDTLGRSKSQEPIVSPDAAVTQLFSAEQPTEQKKQSLKNTSRQPPKKQAKPKWSLDQFEVTPVPGKSRFHDFKLPLKLMRGIAELNFQYCTPIQEKSLPLVLKGDDLVGKANTGTGKSAVFLITILARLSTKKRVYADDGTFKPRALIIAPTRELVIQIARDGRKLGRYTNLKITEVFGGTDYQKQMSRVSEGKSDIIVATPGRLLDFVRKKLLRLSQCEIMVIDEADRMLDMGFIPDVRRIVGMVKPKEKRQTLLFSATINRDVQQLARQWCRKVELVDVEVDQLPIDTVEQIIYLTTTEEKFTVLYNLITRQDHERIMIFTNQKHEAQTLSNKLRDHRIDCVLLSGDVPQQKRTQRLERFRSGKVKVLIATDVAGRGIHIEGISHVVNFTLPYEPENYVHRIGRTGRAGAQGTAISFACEEGSFYLPEIEEFTGKTFECVVPQATMLAQVPEPKPKSLSKKRRRRPRRKPQKQGETTQKQSMLSN
ncbi:MAG: ATP-dependent RNA helicase RhlB [Desulfobulbus propionicus]|nr:MAG: ATP-dependent RNA helicase RhlB [Desulfobulbus propionicus]